MRTEDSHLAMQGHVAVHQDQAAQIPDPDSTSLPEPIPVIPVRDEPAALGIPAMVVLSASNPVLRVLGQNPRRRSAILLAVDSDVYLTRTKDAALDVAGSTAGTTGFYLPAGVAIPVYNKAEYWVACTTTATNSRVSVLISLDDE